MILDQLFRVVVPGRWQEGWLYKDALLAWDQNNVLHRFPIDQLQKQIDLAAGSEFGPLFEVALFRNDWKVSKQFTRLANLRSVNNALRAALQQSFPSEATVQIRPDVQQLPVEPPPGIILDADIYGGRVYIGSTTGAYETRYDPEFAGEPQETVEIFGSRTSCVTAGHSALNISAGDAGLLFKPISFYSRNRRERSTRDDQDLRVVADISEASAFASYNLLNYVGNPVPQLLRANVEKAALDASGLQYDSVKVVSGYDRTERLERKAHDAMAATQLRLDIFSNPYPGRSDSRDVEVLGNAGRRLLVSAFGTTRVLDLDARSPEASIKADQEYGSFDIAIPRDDILATYELGSNFVVESYDRVTMVTPAGTWTIYDGEVANVRTFENSRRYKEVTVIVTENSLELVGFV